MTDLGSSLPAWTTVPRSGSMARLRFSGEHAFDAIAARGSRAARVFAQWGPSTARGEIVVFRREHVYSLDGPVSRLSIDVQVMQLGRGDMFAGKQDNDPLAFIGDVLDAMRMLPADTNHPFEKLTVTATPPCSS